MFLIDKIHKITLLKLERRLHELEDKIARQERRLLELDVKQTNKYKDLLVNILFEAFESDYEYSMSSFSCSWDEYEYTKIRGTLDKRIKTLVDLQVDKKATIEFNKLIKPEEFIDSVVERIKLKQL